MDPMDANTPEILSIASTIGLLSPASTYLRFVIEKISWALHGSRGNTLRHSLGRKCPIEYPPYYFADQTP
jgi:hypothetical protein